MVHNCSTKTIKQIMQAKGLRVTPQRMAVYLNLLDRQDHPTVDDILHDINQILPIASKASVYSAVTTLRKVGLLKEVLLEEGITRYDANIQAHHHFVCRGCGVIKDIPLDFFPQLSLSSLPPGLTGDYCEITVKGYCDVCHG
ncbi:MAG: transcriptional repressor [Synechococcaceae cyanobacterium RL_1_2]|nr:transcriptional repressor [Synechococcaceae cyanobacterium RL_1_2]